MSVCYQEGCSLEGYLAGKGRKEILELSEVDSASRHHRQPSSKEVYKEGTIFLNGENPRFCMSPYTGPQGTPVISITGRNVQYRYERGKFDCWIYFLRLRDEHKPVASASQDHGHEPLRPLRRGRCPLCFSSIDVVVVRASGSCVDR